MNDKKSSIDTNLIPFKVSARTARLIGRENIATSRGAIIELVKNSYDADSKVSIVYFDNKYSILLKDISHEHYTELMRKGIPATTLNQLYSETEDGFRLLDNTQEELTNSFKLALSKFSNLYIIDAGEGMTQNVIRDHWMTIGTDNKSMNVFTSNGRVKAGAKGIGRFALDKLGSKCEMITIFNPLNHAEDIDENGIQTENLGYTWKVDWDDFEGDFKTIDAVNAELYGITSQTNIKDEILKIIPDFDFSQIKVEQVFQYGTILKISNLRDNWDDYYVNEVFSDLEVLVPPKETGDFEIYLYSSLLPDKYGEITGSLYDDYDYKLTAKADDQENVEIKIYRNEYDIELIPADFFERERMKQSPYNKSDFKKGYWKKKTTYSELLAGFKDIDTDNVFANIGIFEFSFYFLKRAYSTPDADRFFYKKFMSNYRKDWLDKFGGIKLFRDNFRVRPYGEVKDSAFDWLGLGSRKSSNPAGIGKKGGGYRVEPENVAGAIKISRLTNVNFEDKSSREGLQDNKTFQVFKRLLTAIINEFEEDRATIAKEMVDYDSIKFGTERDREKAESLAKKIIEENRNRKRNQSVSESGLHEDENDISDSEKKILASEIEKKGEEIEKLKEEQKILRGLASSGIVLASFSHDLSKIKSFLNSRTDKLKNLISEKIREEEFKEVEERKNPFALIENIKKQDLKLQNWLNFSLGATRKDKRKRKLLSLKKYYSDLAADWRVTFQDRGIELDLTQIADLSLRVFEIDFDSIFNNLFVNSMDAFVLLKENRKRKITIKAYSNSKEIIIEYHDSGPGLSTDIVDPERIFEPLFTTKRNHYTGDEEGTGLGMWLVKSIIGENDGVVKLLFPDKGFGLRLILPVKHQR